MSLLKTMENNENMQTSAESNKTYIVRKVLMRAIQKCNFLLKLWAFMSTFVMTTHQIWSCHVTLAKNFEHVNFPLILFLNFRKVTKFGGNWLKNKKVTGKEQKSHVQIGLNLQDINYHLSTITSQVKKVVYCRETTLMFKDVEDAIFDTFEHCSSKQRTSEV